MYSFFKKSTSSHTTYLPTASASTSMDDKVTLIERKHRSTSDSISDKHRTRRLFLSNVFSDSARPDAEELP